MAWSDPGDFTSGQILTAAQMDSIRESMFFGQATFANEAARDTAFGTPMLPITLQEGMSAYLTAPTVPAVSATTYSGVPTGIRTIYNGSVWVCVTPVAAYTVNQGTTTSTSYTTTLSGSPGTNPAVTLVTGTSAFITFTTESANNGGAGQACATSVAVSGATTLAASDDFWIIHDVASATTALTGTTSFVITGLTAGTNTFTLNYRVSGNTGSFSRRSLVVSGIA